MVPAERLLRKLSPACPAGCRYRSSDCAIGAQVELDCWLSGVRISAARSWSSQL